jgi:hypothetical protein
MQPPGATEKTAPPESGAVNDAGISDPSQYVMQTSMTQRDKVRAGSQRGSGSASEYDAAIASRITGMKTKTLDAEPSRHFDMVPKAQDLIIRPWWVRTAGTGYRTDMLRNELYVSQPRSRVAPDNPYVGTETPPAVMDTYGYVPEDSTW